MLVTAPKSMVLRPRTRLLTVFTTSFWYMGMMAHVSWMRCCAFQACVITAGGCYALAAPLANVDTLGRPIWNDPRTPGIAQR